MKTIRARFKGHAREYSFLVEGEVEVGDTLAATRYGDSLKVVNVWDEEYPYLNKVENTLQKEDGENCIPLQTLHVLNWDKSSIPTIKLEE